MVGDDHVQPQRLGRFDLVRAADAAVNRHQQRGRLRDFLDRRVVESVALGVTVGNIVYAAQAQRAEIQRQYRRGAYAVHIVIAVDAHRFARVLRPPDARDGLGHAAQQHWIVQIGRVGIEEGARRLAGFNAAPREEQVDQLGHIGRAFPSRAFRAALNEPVHKIISP